MTSLQKIELVYHGNSIFHILIQLLFFITETSLASLFLKFIIFQLAEGSMKVWGLKIQRPREVLDILLLLGEL